ncbi:hypothetical protein KR200_001161, partial [Drosophila serrata]
SFEQNPSPFQIIMDLNGFDRGLEAEKVITVVDQDGKTLICIQFKGQPNPELIPVDVANLKVSKMLIDFYEAHVRYDLSDLEDEAEFKKSDENEKSKNKAKSNEE